jgi:putative endonuclease
LTGDKPGYVYMMANRPNGTLYIGATSDLVQRAWQHRNCTIDGFTKRYSCTLLVWFEDCGSIDHARLRELQMKKWYRAWKVRLIAATNPTWRDLFDEIVG